MLQKILAQLNCTDIDRSTVWFTTLFGRSPDQAPMDGLKEWHHADFAGFQLFLNPSDAGRGCLTLIVDDIDAELRRLSDAGIETGKVGTGDIATISQLRDPDGNTVVLAEPRE
ncbi:MAG: VOC family protein [Parvularcula sp.]|jgi:predicted enzyme related to lactoylglutathione lyase|nr:VOC family protein [Parvularcula sp.]